MRSAQPPEGGLRGKALLPEGTRGFLLSGARKRIEALRGPCWIAPPAAVPPCFKPIPPPSAHRMVCGLCCHDVRLVGGGERRRAFVCGVTPAGSNGTSMHRGKFPAVTRAGVANALSDMARQHGAVKAC